MEELNLGIVTVSVSEEPAGAVVTLRGELDISVADAVRDVLDASVTSGVDLVVFELSALDFMDSSGIAVILAVSGRVGAVQLLNPSSIIRRIIEATGLGDVLRIIA